MEIFNRKLNMINIAALVILLVLVKHGNTAASAITPANTALTSATSSPAVTTKSSIEKPSTANVSLSNGTLSSTLSPNVSSNKSPSPTTKTTVPITTATKIPTTTTTKAPDECYKISCTNETCPVYENNTINLPSNVPTCMLADGYCYVDKAVNASIITFTMGCKTKCQNKEDIAGCCISNLCNGDLSLLMNSEGQFVKYNFLLSVLCIVISLF